MEALTEIGKTNVINKSAQDIVREMLDSDEEETTSDSEDKELTSDSD
jgi:negative regulator of replication initiation